MLSIYKLLNEGSNEVINWLDNGRGVAVGTGLTTHGYHGFHGLEKIRNTKQNKLTTEKQPGLKRK